jgi:hypothetical protein
MTARGSYPFALGAPVFFALVVGAGCSNAVVSPSSAGSSSTVALLSVERSAAAGDSTVIPRAHASAYFMRLPAGADSNLAARLVGAALTLPAIDQCESADSLWNRGLPLASLEPVDLVDVGQVAIEAGQTTETMAARAFPDVIDLVSGVVYTSRDQIADPLPDGERYVFRISGSPAFPRVAFGATAPSPPTEVLVAGTPLESAPIAVPRQDLALRWRPNGGDSVIYVDIVPNDDGAVTRLRCAFADDGEATVPLAMLPNGATQTISIHRVVRAPAQGVDWDADQTQGEAGSLNLDGGEIRFDLAATGGLRFETAAP